MNTSKVPAGRLKPKLIRATLVVFISFSIISLFSVFPDPFPNFLLGVVSLSIPLLALVNFILCTWFIYRRSWWFAAFASIVPIIVFFWSGLFSVIDREENFEPSFGLVTYNTDQLIDSVTRADYRNDFVKWVNERQFDVLCLQEVIELKDDTFRIAGYKKVFSGKPTSRTEHFGIALFTRLPMINSGTVEFGAPSFNRLVWADVLFDNDTIRIATVHLKSYNFQHNSVRGNIRRLKDGIIYRTWHAKMTKEFIEKSPYPVVLCGDFNEPTHSYSYRVISKGLNSAFNVSGDIFDYTFFLKGMPIRIDHILTSPELRTKDFEITHGLKWSDHSPVSVRIGWQAQASRKRR
ncbi:MAG: endonuclease/exonuclease/phosphatase family protein [Bacteroidota bacterium]